MSKPTSFSWMAGDVAMNAECHKRSKHNVWVREHVDLDGEFGTT